LEEATTVPLPEEELRQSWVRDIGFEPSSAVNTTDCAIRIYEITNKGVGMVDGSVIDGMCRSS